MKYPSHPADPRPNRFAARCCHCKHPVAAGDGYTEKVMGTTSQWRTYHAPCDRAAHPEKYQQASQEK